jgi:hypothetical protein
MDRYFGLHRAKKRVTELLLSDSGAVDVRRTIGLGVAVTGSVLAAILLAPHNASANMCGDPAKFQCGADNNYVCCDKLTQHCCGPGIPGGQYWCCSNVQTCGGAGNCIP